MANPTEPYSVEEIDEAVEQARSCWRSPVSEKYKSTAIGYFTPFLLAHIDGLEAVIQGYKEVKKNLIEDLNAQMKVISELKAGTPLRHPKDCQGLLEAFKKVGLDFTLHECQTLWDWYSREFYSAGWLNIYDNDRSVKELVDRVNKCDEYPLIARILDKKELKARDD